MSRVTASEEELIARTKAATGGGVDASMDFVGLGKTVTRTFNSARKVRKGNNMGIAELWLWAV